MALLKFIIRRAQNLLDFSHPHTYTPYMKTFNLYLTSPQIQKLKALSIKLDLSVAELIRRAIDAYLGREK